MKLSEERRGESYIILEAVLWGLFPVISILSFSSVSPLVSLGWSALVASGVFACLLTVRGTWKDVVNAGALPDILFTTFFIGILYYVFFFFGLQHTSAGNASIVALAEIFFSFCLFNLWRKEHFPQAHVFGALFMLVGACIVLYPSMHSLQRGDFFILAATFVSPFGNFFQRRARARVSSESIMFLRSLLSVPVIFALSFFLGINPFGAHVDASALLLIGISGVFLLGLSKLLWIEAIHRISVTKANALSSLSPFIALVFAYILLHDIPTLYQLSALIPILLGIWLLARDGQPRDKRGIDAV